MCAGPGMPVRNPTCRFHPRTLSHLHTLNSLPSLNFTIMKVVRVQYTLHPEHTEANQKNITAIVAELKTLNHRGIKYGAWLLPDGKTFMHFDQFENEEAHLALQELTSFKKFAAELWAAGFEAEPKLELLSPVASTETHF